MSAGFPFSRDHGGNPVRPVRIHAGDVAVAVHPTSIFTLLGSCVSACLFDPGKGIGGMNHILLPGRADLSRFDDAARFGVNAMELLITRLMKAGAVRTSLRAKVFGGASVIAGLAGENAPGERNSVFILEFLRIEGIPVTASKLGGEKPLRVYFHTHTGDVFLQEVAGMRVSGQVRAEEKKFLARVQEDAGKRQKVEFFPPSKF